MIKTNKDLQEWLKYEQQQYGISSGKDFLKYLYGNEVNVIWNFQKRLRKTEYYKNTGKKFRFAISNFLLNRKRNKYGFQIPLNTCGKGLKIMHIGPILLNGNVKVGNNVSIHIGSCLVAKGISDDAPVIGNHVVIGVNASIIGGITIGDYVAIGAGSVVTKDFRETNITIAGNPARKISDSGRKEWNK